MSRVRVGSATRDIPSRVHMQNLGVEPSFRVPWLIHFIPASIWFIGGEKMMNLLWM
jgi:hypothetical protein